MKARPRRRKRRRMTWTNGLNEKVVESGYGEDQNAKPF